jgi:hypothetical protein
MSISSKVGEITSALNDYCKICSEDAIPRIEGYFAPFEDLPSPSGFDTALSNATQAMEFLCAGNVSEDPVTKSPMFANPDLGAINLVGDELVEWRGEAAESFRDNVQTPFPYISQNLFIGSAVIAGAIEAEKALWTAVEKDINDVADKAAEAAKQLGDTGGAEASFAITCVGAVVAVALAPVTAGASVGAAVSIAAVAGGFSIASSATSVDWSGDHPDDVANGVQKGVDKIKETISEGEKKIRTALTDLSSALTGQPELFKLGATTLDSGPGGLTGLK